VVHAYRLSFTTSLARGATSSSALPGAAAPPLETAALPQLVFRAALGHLRSPAGAPAVPLLLAHPVAPHVLCVVVPSDSAARFYDVAPASDAGGGGGDCSAGAVGLRSGEAVCAAALSRDGALLALASTGARVAVFALRADGGGSGGGGRVRGAQVAAFQCESPVTALSLLHLPAHAHCHAFSRFRYNGYAVATGHANGFLNVWWCGNWCGGGGEGGAPAQAAAAAAYATAPLASYPPFHASRGAITHISPAFMTEDSAPATPHPSPPPLALPPPPSAARLAPTRVRATCIVVGAAGARGWRTYAFPHGAPPALPPPPGAPPLMLRPDAAPGCWGYNEATGRREYLPPPAVDATALTRPAFSAPSYADCLRAVVVGAAGGAGGDRPWAASCDAAMGAFAAAAAGGAAAAATAPPASAGAVPRGVALLQRAPCADSEALGWEAVGDGAAPPVFAGLPPLPATPSSATAADASLFRLLARGGAGTAAHPAYEEGPGGARPLSAPPFAAHVFLPRTVLLLLTERELCLAGYDHAPGLVADLRVRELAAAAAVVTGGRGVAAAAAAAKAAAPPPPAPAPAPQRRRPLPAPQPPAPSPLELATARLAARKLYAPPPPLPRAAAAEPPQPPPRPHFPMATTGRGDAVVFGRPVLFQEAEHRAAAEEAKRSALAETAAGLAVQSEARRARGGGENGGGRGFAFPPPPSPEALAAAAREAKEVARAAVRAAAVRAATPRHSRRRQASAATARAAGAGGAGGEGGDLAATLALRALSLAHVEPPWELAEESMPAAWVVEAEDEGERERASMAALRAAAEARRARKPLAARAQNE